MSNELSFVSGLIFDWLFILNLVWTTLNYVLLSWSMESNVTEPKPLLDSNQAFIYGGPIQLF